MRLIDADKIKKPIYADDDNVTGDGMTYAEMDAYNDGITEAFRAIQNSPTIDAEPVRHGHWDEMDRGHYFKCSICRNPIPYKFGWMLYNGVILNKRYYNYCPNCGAKMDGEQG